VGNGQGIWRAKQESSKVTKNYLFLIQLRRPASFVVDTRVRWGLYHSAVNQDLRLGKPLPAFLVG